VYNCWLYIFLLVVPKIVKIDKAVEFVLTGSDLFNIQLPGEF